MAGHRRFRPFSSYRAAVHDPIYITNTAVVPSIVCVVLISFPVLGLRSRNKVGEEMTSQPVVNVWRGADVRK